MNRIACYFATRNIYPYVMPAVKSMLMNGGVDEIYVFAEDPYLGYPVPDYVYVTDVSGQEWFDRKGPNYKCQWTYMVMMKAAACYLLPEADRALTMDVDTIVTGNLSDLWNIDMTGYCVAGCREPYKTGASMREYVNAGVLYWNLDMMRRGNADRIIRAMNDRKHSNFILYNLAPHSSTFAWKIPWTEEPRRLQSMGSLRVGHN